MKKLTKLKLSDISQMTEDEMKYVVGGYVNTNCTPLTSHLPCVSYQGGTPGHCECNAAKTVCSCVWIIRN